MNFTLSFFRENKGNNWPSSVFNSILTELFYKYFQNEQTILPGDKKYGDDSKHGTGWRISNAPF
jgi:hypothetical protein